MPDSIAMLNRLVSKTVASDKKNAAHQAETDLKSAEYLCELSTFEANAKLLRTKLRLEGITPLSILPHAVWGKLCTHAGGFLRFDVLVDTQEQKKKLVAGKIVRGIQKKPEGTGNGKLDFVIFSGMFALCIISIVCGMVLFSKPSIYTAWSITWCLLIFILPQGTLELIGQRRLQKTLRTEKNSVVYVTEGCRGAAVAIIAKWGEFPIEQTVIDEVLDSTLSI